MSVSTNRTSRSGAKKKKNNNAETDDLTITNKEMNEDDARDACIVLPYDVLRAILSYLPGRELCHAAMVCKLWREVATSELNTRKVKVDAGQFNDFFITPRRGLQYHSNYSISNKPMLCICFHGVPEIEASSVQGFLPSNCTTVCVRNYGLVIENSTEFKFDTVSMSYVLLPDDPDVDIDVIQSNRTRTILTNKNDKSFLFTYNETNNLSNVFKKSISRLKNVQCVILFAKETSACIKLGTVNFKPVKAVWGGVAEDLCVMRNADSNFCHWTALVISGKDVRSWTTYLNDKDRTDEDVKKKLMKLKENIKLLKHTIGFMFACVARDEDWYDNRKNVESTIFKDIFPDIPLIGSVGNGEFGSCSVSEESSQKKKKSMFRQYSTTFMILTYGKKNNSDCDYEPEGESDCD